MLDNVHNHHRRFHPDHNPAEDQEDARYRELSISLGPTLALAYQYWGDYLVVLKDGTQLRIGRVIYEDGSKFISLHPRLPDAADPFSITMQQKIAHPCVRGVQIALADIHFVVQNPDQVY